MGAQSRSVDAKEITKAFSLHQEPICIINWDRITEAYKGSKIKIENTIKVNGSKRNL